MYARTIEMIKAMIEYEHKWELRKSFGNDCRGTWRSCMLKDAREGKLDPNNPIALFCKKYGPGPTRHILHSTKYPNTLEPKELFVPPKVQRKPKVATLITPEIKANLERYYIEWILKEKDYPELIPARQTWRTALMKDLEYNKLSFVSPIVEFYKKHGHTVTYQLTLLHRSKSKKPKPNSKLSKNAQRLKYIAERHEAEDRKAKV